MQIDTSQRAQITAVLGPTNTGKTYLALERMMAHGTGMIGFPLRLLARENYDRVVSIKGAGQVALITGEEKIIPPHARYFMCTVESMPVDRNVDFLAVDEIQLCADADRGHIFTDRLLNARGLHETMFMGSETVAPFIQHLVKDVVFEKRPRFSKLTYTGSKKITRLPSRSAIVAFSASEVYAIAELIRRQKGGAAVVLGALSPRTRNAQVELYQEGEVDYIVATDAIGMGLNMDVDHVAFAALSKFDGHQMRNLRPQELAQIAGRAGRFMKEGTFGVTGDCPLIDPEIVERLEAHEFQDIEQIYWRNSRLRFTNLETLVMDLKRSPQSPGLIRPRTPEDEITLDFLSKNPDITAHATHPQAIRQLWDVCQVPDFSKTMSDSHPRLMGQIYIHLRTHKNVLPTDWVAGHVQRLDRVDGDMDTLTQRLAAIRTWTYISQRSQWLADSGHWQDVTRKIEDKISDALHEQLTKRFVDRRTSTLMKKLKDREELLTAVTTKGDVLVEGHYVGHLDGFHFSVDETDNPHAKRAVNAAALKALHQEMVKRVEVLSQEKDEAFSLTDQGRILWRGSECARLIKGDHILSPDIKPLPFDLLDERLRAHVKTRLQTWLKDHIRTSFAPLERLSAYEASGPARGIVFQLRENLGNMPRKKLEALIAGLSKEDRFKLRKMGLTLARQHVYCPKMLKPHAMKLAARLWCLFQDKTDPFPLPDHAPTSFMRERTVPNALYRAIGYEIYGQTALRLDMVERIADQAWSRSAKKDAVVDGDLVSLVGCTVEQMQDVLKGLGYHIEKKDEVLYFKRRKTRLKNKSAPKKPDKTKNKPSYKVEDYSDSPFAQLKQWSS